MGNRANLVLVDRDGWQLRYSHWAGCRLLDALISGPDFAKRYVLVQEPVDFWTDELWADGGLVLDLVERNVRFFGEELMSSMNERRAMFEALAIVWPGFSISWAYDGTVEIARYVGSSITVQDKPSRPELLLAEDVAKLHHLVSVIGDDGSLRIWPLWWGDNAAWCGPSLIDMLPGDGQRAVELGTLPASGVHVDVSDKRLGVWLTNPVPGLSRWLGQLWPGWRIELWADRYEEQFGRCRSSIAAPELDITSGIIQAESWLEQRVYQSFDDSPAGQVSNLARLMGANERDIEVNSRSVMQVGEKPTAREWERFKAVCALIRQGNNAA